MTTIVRWNPWQELESVQRRIRRMLDDLTPFELPAADVYETDAELVVQLEAPGFEESEIDVEVTDHALVVKGERKEEKEEKQDDKRTFWLHERLERTFERRFELPPGADTEKVSASFAKGVLEVHVPKAATTPFRKVPINA
jgi:HSP20 family protein